MYVQDLLLLHSGIIKIIIEPSSDLDFPVLNKPEGEIQRYK